jgi:erythromycin esterase-like protein
VIAKTTAWFYLAFVGLECMFAQDQFDKKLVENRYELNLKDGHLSGAGSEVLEKAVSGAQFILIGEQHGNTETPEFVSAVCDLAVPQGFHTMALETGPLIAGQLENWISRSDWRGYVAEFEKEFPDSIPFYNLQDEADLLAHCRQRAGDAPFHLWGLDQEFYGESRFLLETLLRDDPDKPATAKVRQMLLENDQAYRRAISTGNVADTFMLAAPESEVQELKQLVSRQNNPAAQAVLNAFVDSRAIYRKHLEGEGYDSNRLRAAMMKELFTRRYEQATRAQGKPAKVLLKFGSAHLYKGINPLHNDDLGNFVTELADGHGSVSLHINVIGAKGADAAFAAPGQPPQIEAFDLLQDTSPSVAFVKPLIAHRLPEGWTLFDLRGLREDFNSLPPMDEELERLIFGYDILIVVPNFTPSTPIRK